ncbi:MAG: hypothetical protein EXR54_02075 [Dehalococcoidia bacterium]|nr:hypothetical protein [Dehalococcoidia bacterium]MSQ16347.1 hypothetical protein [Dehalococcoidia bacterium]
MEVVELERYEAGGILGAGADYEVRAALDRDTGRQVVLKRPKPQMVRRGLHQATEGRTDRTLQIRQDLGPAVTGVSAILGYTQRQNHDAYFGEDWGQEYRVLVEERVRGIPLVGDPMARITGVPVGAAQNLFALFPLTHPVGGSPFAIQEQLLDLEEGFFRAGYILLDLRPQNIFYQPDAGRLTVIDCGDLVTVSAPTDSRGRKRDIHDFFLEILKFYTTPQSPPTQSSGYREAYGLRPVVRFEEELDQMARGYGNVPDPARNAALYLVAKVRDRGYSTVAEFRQDLTVYLEAVRIRNRKLTNLAAAWQAWSEALAWLRGEHWRRYLFDPESELAGLAAPTA